MFFVKKSIFKEKCLIFILLFQFTSYQIINNRVYANEKNQKIDKEKLVNSEQIFQRNHYILGSGDLLYINFIYLDDYSTEILVLNDGTVDIPFIGNIDVVGLTLKSAETKIEEALKKELLNPFIDLKILRQRPMVISVIGEVETPGPYKLNVENEITKNQEVLVYKQLSQPNLIDAIEAAGGIKPTANLRNIELKRLLPGNQNKYKSREINLYKMLTTGIHTENPSLFDSDIIVVKKAEEVDKKNNYRINSFNAKTININVIGEVQNPGLISIKNGSNLTQAILKAGSTLGWRANKNNIELIRMKDNGSLHIKEFSYDIKKGLSKNADIKMVNGDIIRVKTSNLGLLNDSIVVLTNPLKGILTAIALLKIAD